MNHTDRKSALTHISALMREFGFTIDDVRQSMQAESDEAQGQSILLVKVLSYIGGTLACSGIAAFIAMQWSQMNGTARVIITLGSGLAMFAMALAALRDEKYRVAGTPLLLGAAVLQPIGILVALHEYASGGDAQVAAMLTAATVSGQFLLAFLHYARTAMAFVAVFFASAFVGLLLDLINIDASVNALSLGLAWLLLALQTYRGIHRPISPALFLCGCWAALLGLFELLEGTVLEPLFIGAACALTYLGIWARSRTLNFASTLSILAYTAYFTTTHFLGSVGWPIALTSVGLLMIGISSLALRIDKRYLRQNT